MTEETKTFDQLSESELQDAVKKMTSKRLAARVVIWRHLGLHKQLAIACMQELSQRREDGDDFDYESYIKSQLETMPPLTMGSQNNNIITSLLRTNFKDVR